MSAPYPGPVPAYNNPPIQPEFYQPRQFIISNIQLGERTTVTTIDDMDYVIGQEIRLLVPNGFGCTQLNQKIGFVISIPSSNQVEVNIPSNIGVNQYIAFTATTKPQIVAIGDINTGIISTTGRNIPTTNIPGSFINISPL